MQDNGVTLNLCGQEYTVQGTLTMVAGDNLASYYLGGLFPVLFVSADIVWLWQTT